MDISYFNSVGVNKGDEKIRLHPQIELYDTELHERSETVAHIRVKNDKGLQANAWVTLSLNKQNQVIATLSSGDGSVKRIMRMKEPVKR
jgi:hypothetical protein